MTVPYSQGLTDAVNSNSNRQRELEARVLWLEKVVQELAKRIEEIEDETCS